MLAVWPRGASCQWVLGQPTHEPGERRVSRIFGAIRSSFIHQKLDVCYFMPIQSRSFSFEKAYFTRIATTYPSPRCTLWYNAGGEQRGVENVTSFEPICAPCQPSLKCTLFVATPSHWEFLLCPARDCRRKSWIKCNRSIRAALLGANRELVSLQSRLGLLGLTICALWPLGRFRADGFL